MRWPAWPPRLQDGQGDLSKHLLSKPSAGSALQGEANFGSTASGDMKPEGPGTIGLALTTLNRVNGHGAKAPGLTCPGCPSNSSCVRTGTNGHPGRVLTRILQRKLEQVLPTALHHAPRSLV